MTEQGISYTKSSSSIVAILGNRTLLIAVQTIEQHVDADFGGIVAGVAFALRDGCVLERATDVKRREDHAKPPIDLDAFQLRSYLAGFESGFLFAIGFGDGDGSDRVAAESNFSVAPD